MNTLLHKAILKISLQCKRTFGFSDSRTQVSWDDAVLFKVEQHDFLATRLLFFRELVASVVEAAVRHLEGRTHLDKVRVDPDGPASRLHANKRFEIVTVPPTHQSVNVRCELAASVPFADNDSTLSSPDVCLKFHTRTTRCVQARRRCNQLPGIRPATDRCTYSVLCNPALWEHCGSPS